MKINLKHVIAFFIVVAVLALPFLVEWGVKEPGRLKAENVAQEASNNPDISVSCTYFLKELTNTSNHGGFVYEATPNIINISFDNCNKLISVRGKTSNLSEQDWLIIHIIAHELEHTKGFFRESEAECYAIQNSRLVADAWGISQEESDQHIDYYYKNYYPRLPSSYRDARSCSDGGEYDLDPNSNIFP